MGGSGNGPFGQPPKSENSGLFALFPRPAGAGRVMGRPTKTGAVRGCRPQDVVFGV